MSLIPQPSHVESACSPCGCLASLLTQSKVMNISMTDNPEGNEHEWLFVFLCGSYSPGSKPAWERLQQSSTYFHLLACVRKIIHICVYFVHTCCCEPSCSSAQQPITAHTTSGCTGIPKVWILAPLSPCELRAPKHSSPFLSITKSHLVPDAQHSASNDHRV